MTAGEILDKRLLQRGVQKGEMPGEEVDRVGEELPDLVENVRLPDDEELGRLREELEAEGLARAERIERALSEPAQPEPVPVPPVIPEPED